MSKEYTHYMPAEALGITEEQLQAIREEDKDGKWEHITPEFIDTAVQELDLERTKRQMTAAQKSYREEHLYQEKAKIKIDTDLPITVFSIGDVHLGHVSVDHKKFFDDMERIAETPGAYIVLMGNLVDNAMPAQYPDNLTETPIPPDQQVIIMRKAVQEMDEKGRVLASVKAPCHEGWLRRHTGQDLNKMMFGYEGRGFPILENGGTLDLKVGKQSYKMALFHQTGPFESNFNPEHATRQMNRLNLRMEADVVIGAHKHRGAASMNFEGTSKDRKPVAYMRSGTYKGTGHIQDRFARDRYGKTGEPSGESVTLWPNKKRMDAHLEFETGLLAQEAHMVAEMMKKLDK